MDVERSGSNPLAGANRIIGVGRPHPYLLRPYSAIAVYCRLKISAKHISAFLPIRS